MKTARVFNIERFATEDGPGIRTTVFLKGCGLRCKWCANPESQKFRKEIMFNPNLCIACGKCVEACPQNAIEKIEGFGFITNYEKCHHCKKCVDGCFANARTLLGEDYTPERLVTELLKDKEYFAMSGGGVTFSGGEPLLYASFIKEVSKALKSVNIPVLIETCGFVERKNFEEVLPYVDTFFYDIKHMDTQTHEKLTGAGNELILDNLQWLCENFKGKISVRYPYIPPCNDDLPSIKKFLDYINKLKVVKEVWFLPYHRLGNLKYQGLGREYPMGNMKSLQFKDIEFLKAMQSEYHFEIKI